jgi:PTH1 family peptidyl-tRNA hydrolase
MWLIAGLGNPGPRYQNNRHNVGFMVIDELASRASSQGFRDKFGSECAKCLIANQDVLLIKPMEFMNLSGHAVQRHAHFYRIDPENVIVVHDEADFDFGRVAVKSKGGHGGHNGLRSIIDQLGCNDFQRIRVGVGRPTRNLDDAQAGEDNARAAGPKGQVAGYLLSDFAGPQLDGLSELVGQAADAATTVVELGIRAAMNKHNPPAKAKKPKAKRNHKIKSTNTDSNEETATTTETTKASE